MANLSDETFPAVDVNDVLVPGSKKTLAVDPVSAELATTIEKKEQIEAAKQQEEKETKEALRSLKSTIIVSAIVFAVAGALFAISRKLREK